MRIFIFTGLALMAGLFDLGSTSHEVFFGLKPGYRVFESPFESEDYDLAPLQRARRNPEYLVRYPEDWEGYAGNPQPVQRFGRNILRLRETREPLETYDEYFGVLGRGPRSPQDALPFYRTPIANRLIMPARDPRQAPRQDSRQAPRPMSEGVFTGRQEGNANTFGDTQTDTSTGMTSTKIEGALTDSGSIGGSAKTAGAGGTGAKASYGGNLDGSGMLESISESQSGLRGSSARSGVKGSLSGAGTISGSSSGSSLFLDW